MDENNEDKKYDLYTEHIVPNSGKKVRRVLKKVLLVFALAVLFGLVAGLVMIIVHRSGDRIFPDKTTKPEVTLPYVAATTEARTRPTVDSSTEATTPHETVTIPVETETAETTETETETTETTVSEDETIPGVGDIFNIYEAYKAVAARVDSSSVTVEIAEPGVDWLNSGYQNVSYEYGLIVAEDSESYYVLTDYRVTSGEFGITVTYSNGVNREAEVIMGDVVTGMAVIKTPIVKDEKISISAFGNSASVEQGDALIAMGRIYGYTGTVGYGIAAGIGRTVMETDAEYALIDTNIVADGSASGVICNLDGEIVGIITDNYSNGSSNFVSAYAISGIHRQIENLINARQTVYLGIKGQGVTDSIQQLHGIPVGVYLSAVEVNSPAHNSGIQTGDVITAIGRYEITNMSQVMSALSQYAPGETVDVKVKRKGRDSYKEIVFQVTLGVQ